MARLALLLVLAGCSSPSPEWVRPDSSTKWPAESAAVLADAPWMVITCQEVAEGLLYGSGSIVHSSPEHGTWVLTALHCLPRRREPAWVWWIGPGGEELIEAEVVWPPQLDKDGNPRTDDITEELIPLYVFIGDDFAFLRLRDLRIFPEVQLEAPGLAELEDGEDVELRAIAPLGHPHRMRWKYESYKADPEVYRKGHSGSAVLRAGAMTGIISHTMAGSDLVTSRSVTRLERMREVLKGSPLEPLLAR